LLSTDVELEKVASLLIDQADVERARDNVTVVLVGAAVPLG
jgi:serine/threonine protein phosphatase PrpC